MFITDIFKRLFTQSPRFFRIMQIASAIIGAICWGLVQLINRDAIPMSYDMEQIWVPILDGVMKFFAGSLFASATTTTKASLMDEKTKQNVLESGDFQWFWPNSFGNPLVYKKNGVSLSTPTYLLSLHAVFNDVSLGEDQASSPVMMANAEISLTIADNVTITSEFFGAAPKPPHK